MTATRQDVDDASQWLALAREGRLGEAWEVSDRIRERTRTFADPSRARHEQVVWNGTSVVGRHVLVRCYHGLGDTIQFARYLPALRAIAREVTVWAPQGLLPLLQTMPVDARWLPLHDGDPGVDAEVDVEVMELAYVFRTTLDTIPSAVPYLHVRTPPRTPLHRPRIGIVWRAGTWDAGRSIAVGDLGSLLDEVGCDWYSLQHESESSDRHPCLQWMPTDGLLATARALGSLDLLLTIDSMCAHLAGALGVPTWTLLRRHPDWRWMDARMDSPWYPTMRLFRQRTDGDWRDVLRRVRLALAATYDV